jgi:tRNA A-37 threonylcarbamoyl transferase component Bud32
MSAGRTVYRKRLAAPHRLAERAAYVILNNFVVEAILVCLLGALYLGTSAADRFFGTRMRRAFVGWMQAISRDRLNFLRKAQIRHVFKRKYGLKKIKIKLAGGSYWLSIPCIVRGLDKETREEKKYLAKIMNERSVIKHNYMTLMRKLGVLAEGVDLRFDEYRCGLEMGEYEKQCLERLREGGVNAPEVYGLHRLGGDDYMLVMEYITGKPLSKVAIDGPMMDQLFQILRTMRDKGIFHGDVKLDNFMLSGGRVFVFDCLKIDRSEAGVAAAFDLACLLCGLVGKVPARQVINHARRYFSDAELKKAGDMIDMALYKSDLDLGENRIRELKESLVIES